MNLTEDPSVAEILPAAGPVKAPPWGWLMLNKELMVSAGQCGAWLHLAQVHGSSRSSEERPCNGSFLQQIELAE